MGDSAARVRVEWNAPSLKAVESNLAQFQNELRTKILNDAIYKAADIPLAAAIQKVPILTGQLLLSLAKRRARDPDYVGTEVIARRGQYKGGFYAGLVEFGHRIVVRTRRGNIVVGFHPARPYLRPALEENTEKIITRVGSNVAARVNRIQKKAAQK